MANWDENKTINTWCAEEIFIFLTHRTFWLMLGPQLNLIRKTGASTRRHSIVSLRWTQLSITGQTTHTWGKQRHMANTDLFASKHTFTCIHTPTSPLPSPTGSLLSFYLSSQPCNQQKTSLHFLSVNKGLGVTLLYFWSTQAVAHQLPDQRTEQARGSSLTEAIIKTELMF